MSVTKDMIAGGWKCASEQAIKYMMDPRNSINASDIFQFEELTYTECTTTKLKAMTKNTFLSGHEKGILDAAKNNNVNAYYIIARLIQEQGTNGTVLATGAGYNGKYKGYYNPFNIAASGNSVAEILTNALVYAKKMGWDSLDKSIDGGISFVASQYIAKGQNNLYLQKFDVDETNGLYAHQYMQNIMAAQNEGTTLKNTYTNMNAMESEHTFIIPVFENMPTKISARPDTTVTNTTTTDYVKVNATSLTIRKTAAGDSTGNYLYKDEIVTRVEKADDKVNGTYWDKVQKSDGTAGYAARETYETEDTYKLYLIPLNEGATTNTNNTSNTTTTTEVTLPTQVENLKAKSQGQKQITLQWDKISKNVTGYRVYYYDTKTKKKTYIAQTKDNTYIVTGLNVGTTYSFVARAYIKVDGTKHYGSYSSVLTTGTKTATPVISKITAGSKKVTIQWKKVSNANCYQIFMATSKNGTYTRIKSVTDVNKLKYTKKGLTKGKKYYFKIRTYRLVNGVKIYSSYSNISYVKVK